MVRTGAVAMRRGVEALAPVGEAAGEATTGDDAGGVAA
jgi:hypothetical protein